MCDKLGFASSLSALPFRGLSRAPKSDTLCSRRIVSASAGRTRRKENVDGLIYVDSSCIDCDTCRWLSPSIFRRENDQSAVYHQPQTEEELMAGLQAAVACPTGSIRTEMPQKRSKEALASFPKAARDFDGHVVENVFYNGYTSKDTFGCASWLLLGGGDGRPNVMFDCPRFSENLAKNIESLTADTGGVEYLVLSHMDDVAGHDVWAKRLNAKRVIHRTECNMQQGTNECEIKLDLESENKENERYVLAPGMEIIHVPGHTLGSIALLDIPTKSLFTGDHLAFFASLGNLSGSPRFIQHSWSVQNGSVRKLSKESFLHGWPGHGRSFHFKDDADRVQGIEQSAEYMATLTSHRP